MFATAPAEITDTIREFVREKIGTKAEPRFIVITPTPGCGASDCFMNVRNLAKKGGGRIQFGWAVWEWPAVFLEAEHHAVYVPPQGDAWIDPTPCERGSSRRLFVPDDSAIYDFENEGVLRDNLRFALTDDPLVDELFKAAAKRAAFMNQLPGVGQISIHASEDKELRKLQRRLARSTEALAEKYAPDKSI